MEYYTWMKIIFTFYLQIRSVVQLLSFTSHCFHESNTNDVIKKIVGVQHVHIFDTIHANCTSYKLVL